MKNVDVQFNTKTQGVQSSLKELRRRCRKNPGFTRLLKAAAYAQLRRGERTELRASNPKALRALELAVCAFRRQMELDTLGEPTRQVYLMQTGKTWREVSRERAVQGMKRISADAITLMQLTVYSPGISWQDAAELDARHAPELVYIAPETLPFTEDRSRERDGRGTSVQTQARELTPWEEDSATYNDAGELETTHERRKRQGKREHKETFEDAWRPLPLKKSVPARAPVIAKPLPAAPWYYALESKMQPEYQATLSAERQEHQHRRATLDDDENERLELYDLDAELNPEDLEDGMLEPCEALERFSAGH